MKYCRLKFMFKFLLCFTFVVFFSNSLHAGGSFTFKWGNDSEPEQQQAYRAIRQTYGSLLMNGPFSIIVAHHGEMIGLTDRIKLRPLVAGTKGDFVYMSSEEAAIRLVSPQLDKFWAPRGGEPVVGKLRNPKTASSEEN